VIIVKFIIYKIIFIIIVFYDYELKQMNVKTIFLHNNLKEIVYVVQLNEYKKKKKKSCAD